MSTWDELVKRLWDRSGEQVKIGQRINTNGGEMSKDYLIFFGGIALVMIGFVMYLLNCITESDK